MNTQFEKYLEAKETINEILGSGGAEKIVTDALKDFFDNFGDIVGAIQWNQYTPSFNDGDPCTFSVGEIYFAPPSVLEADDYEPYECFEEYEGCIDEWGFNERNENKPDWVTKELTEGFHKLRKVLHDEDLLERAFGSGTTITASRAGVETYSYDCGY